MNNKDYEDFLNPGKKETPKSLSGNILSTIQKEMNPNHKIIFFKLLTIQAFIGFTTLLFCPQFNYSLTNNYELFHYFHRTFGEYGCMSICGIIFIGSGAIFSSYILNFSEIKAIHQHNFLYYFSLSGLGALTFLLFGADVYLDIAFFWILGGLIGGILLFEINRLARIKYASLH